MDDEEPVTVTEGPTTVSCRKCGKPNPPTNRYCAGCGAVLLVSTAMVNAQPRPVLPIIEHLEPRWILLGVPVMLGAGTFALLTGGLLGAAVFTAAGAPGTLLSWKTTASHFLATLGLLMGGAFALAGALMSRISGGRRTAEAAVGALLAALLLGVASLSVGTHLLFAVLILSLPGTACAALGARLGAPKERSP